MPQIKLSPDVRDALAQGLPAVALESTIISHGMPFPQNLEMARKVQETIRAEGAVPATIALFHGEARAGLSDPELEEFAQAGPSIRKVSRRDLPIVMARKEHGATTVASTMILASWAGLRIFATGGIGGVHRGAETSMDISADLEELAQTNLAVVCAGAKSILDLGLTLEVLETRGVPVLGYQTRELPAFYTRDSGFPVDEKINSPEDAARILHCKWKSNLKGGVVIANPVPEAFSLDRKLMDETIGKALEDMKRLGIKGKDSTPFLLKKIKELTGGRSLETNMALVLNNARLAAQIAIALNSLCKEEPLPQ